MKILHDFDSYMIVLDSGEESPLEDFGDIAVVTKLRGSEVFIAYLCPPENSNQDYSSPDGMEPVAYLLTPQPTTVEETEFEDSEEPEDEDEDSGPERSEPEPI